MNKSSNYLKGIKMGIPIGIGYFAVSISLGIFAKNAGLTAFQASLSSLLLNASAGEYAAFSLIAADAGYFEIALMEFIANARYMLMSCALSQKLSEKSRMSDRMIIGMAVTDEMFGSSIIHPGKVMPSYYFGMMSVAMPCWMLGTCVGVILGNVLPQSIVSALGVSLYGMFLATFVPAARENRVILGVVVISMILSFICSILPFMSAISSGTQIIILTVVISAVAALLFPVQEEENEA